MHLQVDLIAGLDEVVPPVVMHGNVTDWNVVVPPTGPLVLVDWEFSEPLAPPLWDLFHFERMEAWRPTGGWRRRILRWPTRTDTFLKSSEGRMGDSIERYCAEVGVPHEAVAPLFHFCWAHLCLNEATHADHLASGPFMTVLRRSVALAQAGRLEEHTRPRRKARSPNRLTR